ncbi:MAG: addiction module protein [Saprospiraceae bacterium]
MSKNFETILEKVRQLSREEQLALAAWIESGEELEIPTQVIEEGRRRLAAYDAGKSEPIPYKQAMEEIRRELKIAG